MKNFTEFEVANVVGEAVENEREACARIADGAAEGAGSAGRGDRLSSNDEVKAAGLEIARRIRLRTLSATPLR